MNCRKEILAGLLIPLILCGQFSAINPIDNKDDSEAHSQQIKIDTGTQGILLEEIIEPAEYIIGAGDEFLVTMVAPENAAYTLKVSPTGNVTIPGIGVISVSGISLEKAVSRMIDRSQAVIRDIQMSVDLRSLRQFKIWIYGAVSEPGYYTATPVTRPHEIALLAGLKPLAVLSKVEMIDSDGRVSYLNWNELMLAGDQAQNPYLKEGDIIHIPFASWDRDLVAIRGATFQRGYFALEQGETLSSILRRVVDFTQNVDITTAVVLREEDGKIKQIKVSPPEFEKFLMRGGDVIEILAEENIRVNGHVAAPGKFDFTPGMAAIDYIAMAGGVLNSGTIHRINVIHKDGNVEHGSDVLVKAGDIIEVRRGTLHVLIGDMSAIQILTAFATLTLSYLAISAP